MIINFLHMPWGFLFGNLADAQDNDISTGISILDNLDDVLEKEMSTKQKGGGPSA